LQVKRFLFQLYACNLGLALILGSIVYAAIENDLGSSLAGQRMSEGFDSLWYDGFSARATGPAATFSPSVAGAGAIFDGIDAFLDGFTVDGQVHGYGPPASGVRRVVVLYLFVSAFFTAGLLALFVSQTRRAQPLPFFAGAARFFPRMLLLSLMGYFWFWLVFGPLRFWLDARVASALADSIDERVQLAQTLGEYGLLWFLIWLGGLVLSLSKTASVRAGETSLLSGVVTGLSTGVTIALKHPIQTGALYASIGLLWLLMTAFYTAVVPGAAIQPGLAVALTFVLGQLYILGRITLRTLVFASEVKLLHALEGNNP
jgi:hypothetical protein